MLARLSSIFSRFFWPLLVVLLAASLTLVLWTGRPENAKYAEMACTFENRAPTCIDSVRDWREGLAFYDSSLSVTRDPLASLKLLLWDFWNIEFAGAGEASIAHDAILPLRVLETRKSGCMGLSWLAMMVAEARGIPLEVILLPGHVYLRYGKDDGRAQAGFAPKTVNLEPNRRGYTYTDEEYREKYKAGHWTGLEFKPLTPAQFTGLAAFDMGNLYLETEPTRALRWYRLADDLFPEYPGIAENQKIAKSRLPDSMP